MRERIPSFGTYEIVAWLLLLNLLPTLLAVTALVHSIDHLELAVMFLVFATMLLGKVSVLTVSESAVGT